MVEETLNPTINDIHDIHNFEFEISNDIYKSMVEENTVGIRANDPNIGDVFSVKTINVDDNGLYAIIEGNVRIPMTFTEEAIWIKNVLLNNINTITNKSSMVDFISANQGIINIFCEENNICLTITKNTNNSTLGSISQWMRYVMYGNFFNDINNPDEASIYTCKILDRNKGGFFGYINGVEVFIPGSLAYHKKIEDYDDMYNEEIPVMIESYAPDKEIFIASNKKYVQKITPTLINELDRNEPITGTITGVSDFGIFINFLEYANGLLHTSEMSDTTLERYKNGEFKTGDSFDFFIKSYTANKIILTEQDFKIIKSNWDSLVSKYNNKVVKCKMFKKVSSGYLFDIDNSTKALLYDIEAKKYNIRFEEGKYYDIYVDNMDFNSGKIFLSYHKK